MSLEQNPHIQNSEALESSRKLFEQMHGPKTAEDLEKQREQTAHFEEEWGNPSVIQIEDEEFSVYQVHPTHAETAVPTLVVPGWSATPEVFKENMRALVGEGISAIAIDAPHGAEHALEPAEQVGTVPDSELRRINAFKTALDASSIEKADAIGHSQGGLDVLFAAAMFPEKFRTIVLVNPAGMIEDDTTARLALRFAHDMVRSSSFAKKEGTLAQKKIQDTLSMPAIVNNPIRAGKEVLVMGRSTVYDLLRQVSEAGVDVIVIHGPDDVVFPMKKMQETIHNQKNEQTEDITKLLKGFYSVEGDHNTFVRRAPLYTRLAAAAIKTREAKLGEETQ